ncbi:dUTP diphosphatase [Bacillus sp. MRMR6]|uniref:dUTP diphosphatase n=1 Tax=Bacillus sp. MRMR6 TaxID=1928617 RepID=UPI0009524378|nr:dUTP diphosphatase [Bacillus sp. MRMR6]OLS39114.1 hypothetical protein BTR25_13350 [Bacillus sp. MRMR6]
MDLEKMLEMQKALDERIIKEKGLEGQELFPNTVLALQVELGEFANEGRWFKHWSDNKVPKHGVNALIDCPKCSGNGFWFAGNRVWCSNCKHTGKIFNPLLVEFVDGVHFFLSIAIQKGWEDALWVYEEQLDPEEFDNNLTDYYLEMVYHLNTCYMHKYSKDAKIAGYQANQYWFRMAWILFLNIGINGFDFTQEQIEGAYFAKNAVNHKRQEDGY